MTTGREQDRPRMLYRMDNGETYAAPIPRAFGSDQHTKVIHGVENAMRSGEPVAVECEGVGWVIANPAHVVAIEFVGDWEVSA